MAYVDVTQKPLPGSPEFSQFISRWDEEDARYWHDGLSTALPLVNQKGAEFLLRGNHVVIYQEIDTQLEEATLLREHIEEANSDDPEVATILLSAAIDSRTIGILETTINSFKHLRAELEAQRFARWCRQVGADVEELGETEKAALVEEWKLLDEATRKLHPAFGRGKALAVRGTINSINAEHGLSDIEFIATTKEVAGLHRLPKPPKGRVVSWGRNEPRT